MKRRMGQCTSHNTPVIFLENFQIFWVTLSHSIRIRDSRKLMFCTRTGCTPSDTIHLHVTTTSGSSESWKISSPDPISYYSLSLTSCSVRLCIPVSPIHVTSHSCVSHSHFRYPRLWFCLHCLLDPLCDSTLWFHTSGITLASVKTLRSISSKATLCSGLTSELSGTLSEIFGHMIVGS